jgi:hypothetical protein
LRIDILNAEAAEIESGGEAEMKTLSASIRESLTPPSPIGWEPGWG